MRACRVSRRKRREEGGKKSPRARIRSRGDLRAVRMKIRDAEREGPPPNICGEFRGPRLKSNNRRRTNHFNEHFIQITDFIHGSRCRSRVAFVIQVCPVSSGTSKHPRNIVCPRFPVLPFIRGSSAAIYCRLSRAENFFAMLFLFLFYHESLTFNVRNILRELIY